MRIAQQSSSAAAVNKADSAVAHLLSANGLPKVPMSCEFGHLRMQWFDEYVKNGGAFVEVCEERFAPFDPDPVIAQVADQIFFKRHPELKSHPLSLRHDDHDLRSEWMDLYVEFGGRIAEICSQKVCAS
ncbi:hypothetical protein [Bradyrhizobium diazoefficiens]|uniref:hypothetical protein n=1 Tax=Bradyrhizobium diazoefficiens TaxID=1355477 RepID=UPI001B4CEACB|nr:hypothetical protein [Bradyrhizobium japonicum]